MAKKPPANAPDETLHSDTGGVATLDPPTEAPDDIAEAEIAPDDSIAVWATENVTYLFEPESRELQGATITVKWDDGQTGDTYEAQIKRDGGGNWAWWEGEDYRGNHAPGIQFIVGRALAAGRQRVLSGMT